MVLHATDPQVYPNIMSCPKSSIQSLALASTAAGTSSKPPSAIAPNRDSQQALDDLLASYGIKVRDFAYESTLPPIAPVRFLPRQIQPGLKRVRQGEEENPFIQSPPRDTGAEGSNFIKKLKLGREVTEPDLQSSSLPPTRARGFTNLDDYDHSTESQLISTSQQSDWPSQPPLQYDDSQEFEPYIDTPLVTPNGSLQWPVANTSSIPASQLDTASQDAASELLSYSQLGFTHPDESSQQESTTIGSPALPESPLPPRPGACSSTLPYSLGSPSPLPRPTVAPIQALNALAPPHPSASLSTAPRYHLRQRVIPSPPIKQTSKSRRNTRPAHLASRAIVHSMQSSHSRTKTQNPKGSPNSRTLRTRTAAINGRDDPMAVR